jgi:hypothetical protein
VKTTSHIPNGPGILPPSPAPASGRPAPVTEASRIRAGFPPGADPAGQARVRDAWPLSAAPLALAALPGADECASLRARLVAAEWGLGRLAAATGHVARDLMASAVAASQGLPGQPVVRLWLRGDGSRLLIAVWDGCAGPSAGNGEGEWPFSGVTEERGWHEHDGGRTCWSVLSWRVAHPGTAAGRPLGEAAVGRPHQLRATSYLSTNGPGSRKAMTMTAVRCTCGFTEAEGAIETMGDHLLEVFVPEDGKGPDGTVHLEGGVGLFCLCGAGGTAEQLDAHFLAVFTPPDSVGRDGVKHERLAR